jgi:hypothetical protein
MIDPWTQDTETLLNKIRINCNVLSEYHRTRYIKLKESIKWFRIPVIIISGINSVFSVGLNSFVDQSAVSVLNCLLSLICGIIVSIELYLQLQTQIDTCHSNSKDFYLLGIQIFKILSLVPENRNVEPSSYLDETYASYTKYISQSNIIKTKLADSLQEIPIYKNTPIYDVVVESPEAVCEIPTRAVSAL